MDKVIIPNPISYEVRTFTDIFGEKLEALESRNYVEVSCEDASLASDGYHTFADLYQQRLYLSAALANSSPFAWKSKLHSDGTAPFDGTYFIMGWETPAGSYTYHYKLEYWDMFHCTELARAPEWDGHTSKDIDRLSYLPEIHEVGEKSMIGIHFTTEGTSVDEARKMVQWVGKHYPNNMVYGMFGNDRIEIKG